MAYKGDRCYCACKASWYLSWWVLALDFLGILPSDGLHMAPTEEAEIPHGIVVVTDSRDQLVDKPHDDERIPEHAGFTVLPGFLVPTVYPGVEPGIWWR